jgi:hypothetical protein
MPPHRTPEEKGFVLGMSPEEGLLHNQSLRGEQRLSQRALGVVIGCSRPALMEAQARLRANGDLPLPSGGYVKKKWQRERQRERSGHRIALSDILRDTKVLTADERKRLASALALDPGSGVNVQALKLLEDQETRLGEQVGPRPPLSEKEVVERAIRLLKAIGLKATLAAVQGAYPNPTRTEVKSETT